MYPGNLNLETTGQVVVVEFSVNAVATQFGCGKLCDTRNFNLVRIGDITKQMYNL